MVPKNREENLGAFNVRMRERDGHIHNRSQRRGMTVENVKAGRLMINEDRIRADKEFC